MRPAMTKNEVANEDESIREQDVERNWYVVDLDNKVLGRRNPHCDRPAQHKPFFTPTWTAAITSS